MQGFKNLVLMVFIFIGLNGGAKSKNKKNELRDPFNLPSKSVNTKNKSTVKLVGIIRSENKFGAVLEFGSKTETVFLNDIFGGFKVSDIKSDHIILSKGRINKKLFIE